MSDSHTERSGKTQFNQSQNEAGQSTLAASASSAAAKSSTSKRDLKSTSERDLRSSTDVHRSSSESSHIAFEISFSVPILGRFPTKPGQPNC